MIGNLPPWSAHIKPGTVRAIAVTTANATPACLRYRHWPRPCPVSRPSRGSASSPPQEHPRAVCERVNVVINRALELADVKARLATLGRDPAGTTPEAFAGHVNFDVARWKKLAAEKQIRAD